MPAARTLESSSPPPATIAARTCSRASHASRARPGSAASCSPLSTTLHTLQPNSPLPLPLPPGSNPSTTPNTSGIAVLSCRECHELADYAEVQRARLQVVRLAAKNNNPLISDLAWVPESVAPVQRARTEFQPPTAPRMQRIMPGQHTRPYFRAPTCVLKGSDDDDVEDRRHDPCCASDGGRSSGVAVQAEIPNHRRLRRSRAGVVSAAVDVSLLAGRVCDEKTNMCEPLLTHRNEITMASKLGSVGGPGTKARRGGPSVGELPVCGPGGARCIGGVSSSQALAWNRRTCRPDRDGRCFWPREGEPQAADTASGRVPMRGTGADRPVVAVRAL